MKRRNFWKTAQSRKTFGGINIYPEERKENFIEFDSMINLRPGQGNRSRGVESKAIRKKIINILDKLIKDGLPT